MPQSEWVARPLSELPAEEQGDAWLEAVTSAPDGQPTAEHVEEVVERRKQVEPPAPITDRRGQAITDPSIAAVFTDSGRIARLMTACSVLKRDIREVCDQPVGAWLKDQLQTCETLCDDLRHRIKISLPYALTPPRPAPISLRAVVHPAAPAPCPGPVFSASAGRLRLLAEVANQKCRGRGGRVPAPSVGRRIQPQGSLLLRALRLRTPPSPPARHPPNALVGVACPAVLRRLKTRPDALG